jgi:hypothetical protein
VDSFKLSIIQEIEDQTGDDFNENSMQWSNDMVNRNSLYTGTVANVAIYIIYHCWICYDVNLKTPKFFGLLVKTL